MCEVCHGMGCPCCDPEPECEVCPACKGEGVIRYDDNGDDVSKKDFDPEIHFEEECARCCGTGWVEVEPNEKDEDYEYESKTGK